MYNSKQKGVGTCFGRATLNIPLDFRYKGFSLFLRVLITLFFAFLATFEENDPLHRLRNSAATISDGHDIWYNWFVFLLLNFRFSVLLWLLAMLKWARMNLWQMSILPWISWSPFWRRTGRMCERSISRAQWESLSVCIRVLLCAVNKSALKCRIIDHAYYRYIVSCWWLLLVVCKETVLLCPQASKTLAYN